jgi:hypothetical protein
LRGVGFLGPGRCRAENHRCNERRESGEHEPSGPAGPRGVKMHWGAHDSLGGFCSRGELAGHVNVI